MGEKQPIFARHRPEETPLYRVIYHHRDELERCWDERFEDKFGKLKECVLEAFDSYLNCGIPTYLSLRAGQVFFSRVRELVRQFQQIRQSQS